MRKLFALAAIAGLVAPVSGQDTKPKADPPKKPEAVLKVGDKAPTIKATKWLQGAEVKEFAAGKTYVMEFWATWCGPCIVMMPHMGELQTQYKDKGVTFIGFSAKDANNPLEKVQALVEKRGPKLGYTFAFADNRETYDAWMTAAGQSGIPCCFVVDKAGKIAYIGHPMYLDVVLPKVVAGTWAAADLEGIKAIEEDVNAVFKATGDKDPEAFLKALGAFEKKHPALSAIPYFHSARLGSLVKSKKTEDVKKVSEELIAKAIKADDTGLVNTVTRTLVLFPDATANKDLHPTALKAAEAGLKLAGDKDPVALFFLAEAHFLNGDKAKAKDFGAKAVASADGPLKQDIETRVKRYDEEKKEEKKDK
ncbi:TlpA family protein disulfide reductase [Gemmata sp. G18]|uniref:TlpA family protein disulfide reductase n=1 Tax=Gemmata palustris TaxID=2822762 RepID=A0ABS5C3R3_9BACT|nr:TlpA disulfide reductase family protein [Gemmata palustris]MBP3960614.1 TlpA family protein disulfide reductase [Gemmata palustris]